MQQGELCVFWTEKKHKDGEEAGLHLCLAALGHGAWSMSPAILRVTCVAGARAEPESLS